MEGNREKRASCMATPDQTIKTPFSPPGCPHEPFSPIRGYGRHRKMEAPGEKGSWMGGRAGPGGAPQHRRDRTGKESQSFSPPRSKSAIARRKSNRLPQCTERGKICRGQGEATCSCCPRIPGFARLPPRLLPFFIKERVTYVYCQRTSGPRNP